MTQIRYITGLLYNRVFNHENNKPLHWRKPGIIFEVLIWKIFSYVAFQLLVAQFLNHLS